MLHRLLPAAGAVVLALALNGCTSSSTTPPAATSSAAASSATPTAVPSGATPTPSGSYSAAEAQYLAFVKQFSPVLAAKSDEDLIGLGRQICAGFAKGEDEAQIARTLGADDRAQDLDATGAAALLGGAVGALCPEYRNALQGNG